MERSIASLLPSDARNTYEAFPQRQRGDFEAALQGISRLGDPKYEKYLAVNNFSENVLEHVCTMLEIVNEIKVNCPNIAAEVDLNVVRFMVILHDAGEICIGDIPSYGPLREAKAAKRKKRREPHHALTCIISQIEDEQVRERAEGFYLRYVEQDRQDKEALLAKFIDKSAGTARVNAPNVFATWRLMGHRVPPFEMQEHVGAMYRLLKHQAWLVEDALGAEEAKSEMSMLFYIDEEKLFWAGYP